MTITQFYGASSLDGYIATPDHDPGWLLQFGEIEGSSYPDFIHNWARWPWDHTPTNGC